MGNKTRAPGFQGPICCTADRRIGCHIWSTAFKEWHLSQVGTLYKGRPQRLGTSGKVLVASRLPRFEKVTRQICILSQKWRSFRLTDGSQCWKTLPKIESVVTQKKHAPGMPILGAGRVLQISLISRARIPYRCTRIKL